MTDQTVPRRADVARTARDADRRRDRRQSHGVLERGGLAGPDTHFSLRRAWPSRTSAPLLAGAAVRRAASASMLIDMATGVSHDVVVCPARTASSRARVLDPAVDGQVPVVIAEFALVEEIVHQRRALARGDGQARADRPRPAARQPAVGRRARRERARPPHPALLHLRAEDARRPRLGASGRRRHGRWSTSSPARCSTSIDYVDLPVPQRGRQLPPRRRGVGPDRAGPEADRDHPAGGPELHHRRRRRARLGWAGTCRSASTSARAWCFHNVSHRRRRRRQRPGALPRVHRRDDGAVRRPEPAALVPELLRLRRVPARRLRQLARTGLRLRRRHHLPRRGASPATTATPRVIPQAICIHEEDTGILWKHFDNWNGSSDLAPQPAPGRLASSSPSATTTTASTGTSASTARSSSRSRRRVSCSPPPTRAPATRSPRELAPGLGAPYHQHLFSARLDMMVDGARQRRRRARGGARAARAANPTGTGFTQTVTRLRTETRRPAAGRQHAGTGSGWSRNPSVQEPAGRRRRLGALPGGQAGAAGRRGVRHPRARDVRDEAPLGHAVRADELYPAGDFVNLHPGGAGLPGLDRGRPRRRRHRHRAVAHLRAHPLPAHRGLAGHAGRHLPVSCSSRTASSAATRRSTSRRPTSDHCAPGGTPHDTEPRPPRPRTRRYRPS